MTLHKLAELALACKYSDGYNYVLSTHERLSWLSGLLYIHGGMVKLCGAFGGSGWLGMNV